MVLLQTVLVLIIVYYLLKILWKWLAPKLLNYAVQKTEERFGKEFGQFSTGPYNTRGQDEYVKPKRRMPKPNPSKKVGEYIDFEEIE